MVVRDRYLRRQVLKRDLGLCRCCGFKANEVHHIKLLVYGGKDIIRNMVSLCYYCHINAPDDEEEFIIYMNSGGAKIPYLFGNFIIAMEDKKIDYNKYIPLFKRIVNTVRNLDYKYAIEKYSLKECLTIKDIPKRFNRLDNKLIKRIKR